MNDNYNTYRIWAPDNALWTQWAKPVLFARTLQQVPEKLVLPAVKWAPYGDGRTALFVDLPGKRGVLEGLALAQMGYRPVPLYNGVYGADKWSMAVDVTSVAETLYQGADYLSCLHIRPDAPPAFLLDAARMKGTARQPGRYDNRWCVFPQDAPSADFLKAQGIESIYVRTKEIQNDLAHILLRYQKKGIRIYQVRDNGVPKKLTVVRPSHFKSFLYRFCTLLGLTRNAAGDSAEWCPRLPSPQEPGIMVLARKRRKNVKSSYCLEDVCQAIGRFVKRNAIIFHTLPAGSGQFSAGQSGWYQQFRHWNIQLPEY